MTLDELNESKDAKVDKVDNEQRASLPGRIHWPGMSVFPRLPGYISPETSIIMNDATGRIEREAIRRLVTDGHLGAVESDYDYDW